MALRLFDFLSLCKHPHRWPQTSTRCWQTKVTCWSAAAWSRSKVKGKWRPTSWTTGLPTVSRQGERPTPGPRPAEGHSSTERGLTVQRVAEKLETPSLEFRAKRWGKKKKKNQTFKRLQNRKCSWWEENVLAGHFGSRPCWRTSVFLMSSLSLRLLERCKVCLFKTTPFSLCQKKINAVHKATFYFVLAVLFLSLFFLQNLFISHGLWTGTHVFVCWVDYLFWI